MMINYHMSIKSLEKYQAIKADDIQSQILQDPTVSEYVEPKIHPLILLSLLQTNPYHSSACSIKANDILKNGYTIENSTQEIDEFIRACKPSFEFILLQFLEDLQVFNYATMEVVRDNSGKPVRLEYVPAHTVRVHEDETRYRHTWDGIKTTYFKDYRFEGEIDKTTGEDTEAINANEMISLHLPSPMCTYYGVPRYISAIPSILAMNKIDNYNYAFFDNFTIPSYVITVTGDFEDEEIVDGQGNPTGKTILQELIEENFTYIRDNPHTPIVLSIPGGDSVEVQFTPLNTTEKDSSFKNYYDDKKMDIAAAHMIDPYRLGIMEVGPLGGSFADVTRRTYQESVIRPQQSIISSVLTDFLQVKFDSDAVFQFNNEVILESELVRNYVSLIQAGVLTPAEARQRLFGMDGGIESFYLPAQLLPQTTPKAMKATQPINDYKKILKKEYKALREHLQNILDSNLTAEEKKIQIDMALAEFRNIGERKIREALPAAYERGRISTGANTLIASSQTIDKYIELQLTSLDDFIQKIRGYLYKVVVASS